MRAALDTDFNAPSRALDLKIEIYFSGMNADPLVVTKDTYLIDADWLEEGSAESSNPFGAVSSNEVSFRLHNPNGMFSPTDTSSPYYGLIKSGVPIILYMRPISSQEEIDWEQLGVFYVTDWSAKVTSIYADVTANDIWYYIFSNPLPNYPVTINKTFYDFIHEVLALMGYDVTISELLNTVLPYVFVQGNIQEFLQEVTAAALAYVTSSKDGVPTIGSLLDSKEVRAVLTDSDQVKDISVTHSITKSYEGVELTYNIPQVSAISKLVDITNVRVPAGSTKVPNIALSSGPLWQVLSVNTISFSEAVKFKGYKATPWLISIDLENTGEEDFADLKVFGTVVSLTEAVITDEGTRLYKMSNKYIQSAEYAALYNRVLKAFVTSTIPMLTVSIRGNPLLKVGDRVSIQSTKYKLDFTGIIQRLKYKYAGSFSCEMTLLNTDVLQEVLK
jgi:hypothetical protein